MTMSNGKKWVFFGVFVLVCMLAFFMLSSTPKITRNRLEAVGFFTPRGVPLELVEKTGLGMINAIDVTQVSRNLKNLNATDFKLIVDLGPVLTHPVPPEKISSSYAAKDGVERKKIFLPKKNAKILEFPDDQKFIEIIDPYLVSMKPFKKNLFAVFLADEPYLNGISKIEMERSARIIRSRLDFHGPHSVKIGVIFASALFDADFSSFINKAAGEYVKAIDDHYSKNFKNEHEDFKTWIKSIENDRLTTYDQAGNIYTGGGIPSGFDIVGFDFYLSTTLLDNLHIDTLDWFAQNTKIPACQKFLGHSMKDIKSSLSFFKDGPVDGGNYKSDKKILDGLYSCRMGAVTEILKKNMPSQRTGALMISESSGNGVLEFDGAGRIEQGQPEMLVEKRVKDEVLRALDFYKNNKNIYSDGLLFFTYENEYDNTINLNIGGASKMPSVLHEIFNFTTASVN